MTVARPRVVLLPGIRGDAREWGPLRSYLPEDSVALDLPTLPSPSLLLDHASGLLAQLPEGPLVLVGASFGGLVARALVALHARPITHVCTIGTLPAPSPASRRAGWSAPLVRHLPGRLYRELYGARAEADWLADDPDRERYAALQLPSQTALAARLGALGRWSLPPRVQVPSTYLWGATDTYARWGHADVEAVGGVPVIVPGGHRPHLSHPAEVAAWVRWALTQPYG